MKIILDIETEINELIETLGINVNDPQEIFRLDEILLRSFQTYQKLMFDEINNILILKKYLIKKHNFIYTSEDKNDIK